MVFGRLVQHEAEQGAWHFKVFKSQRKVAGEKKGMCRKKGIKYCDECKQWPCELLKREVLTPMDLQRFKEFMSKI